MLWSSRFRVVPNCFVSLKCRLLIEHLHSLTFCLPLSCTLFANDQARNRLRSLCSDRKDWSSSWNRSFPTHPKQSWKEGELSLCPLQFVPRTWAHFGIFPSKTPLYPVDLHHLGHNWSVRSSNRSPASTRHYQVEFGRWRWEMETVSSQERLGFSNGRWNYQDSQSFRNRHWWRWKHQVK